MAIYSWFSHSNGWIFHSYMLVYQRVYGSVDSCHLWWLGKCLEGDGKFYMGQIIFMVRTWWIWDEQSLENDWEHQNHRENIGGTWWKMLRKCFENSRERMENGFHHELWENDGRAEWTSHNESQPNPGVPWNNCCHVWLLKFGCFSNLQYFMYHDIPGLVNIQNLLLKPWPSRNSGFAH